MNSFAKHISAELQVRFMLDKAEADENAEREAGSWGDPATTDARAAAEQCAERYGLDSIETMATNWQLSGQELVRAQEQLAAMHRVIDKRAKHVAPRKALEAVREMILHRFTATVRDEVPEWYDVAGLVDEALKELDR